MSNSSRFTRRNFLSSSTMAAVAGSFLVSKKTHGNYRGSQISGRTNTNRKHWKKMVGC